MKRSLSIKLGAFASEVLEGEQASENTPLESNVARAIRCYLNDKESSGPGWSYPSFLGQRPPNNEVEIFLSIDESLWRSLEEEAERQGVSAQQMLEHAVLYFAAEINAGRLTERILMELDEG